MKDLFIGFLTDNNALDKFEEALVIGREPKIDVYINRVEPCEFIYGSCHWIKLKEGHSYWSKLNSKWLEIIEKQQQNEKNN